MRLSLLTFGGLLFLCPATVKIFNPGVMRGFPPELVSYPPLHCQNLTADTGPLLRNLAYRPGARRSRVSGENVRRAGQNGRNAPARANRVHPVIARSHSRTRSRGQGTEERPHTPEEQPLPAPELQCRCRTKRAARRTSCYPPEANPLRFSFSFSCPPYALNKSTLITKANCLNWRGERKPPGCAAPPAGGFQPFT
jgi:hypothetical protein